ncbi:MAG: type II toxin-antitoxin system RelE/ParE family toxin [Bacteroidales bacterium]|jgi:plasmid stabilization system protein ParE
MRKVIWTPIAIKSLIKVIEYLEENWTEKEINKFLYLLNSTISRLKRFPETSVAIKGRTSRRSVIDKNNNIVFKVTPKNIIILHIFDSRQNPKKLNFITK